MLQKSAGDLRNEDEFKADFIWMQIYEDQSDGLSETWVTCDLLLPRTSNSVSRGTLTKHKGCMNKSWNCLFLIMAATVVSLSFCIFRRSAVEGTRCCTFTLLLLPSSRPVLWVLLWRREQFMHLLIYLFACQCGAFLSGPQLATVKPTCARLSQLKAETRRCAVGWLFTKKVKESGITSVPFSRFALFAQ